MTSSVWTPRKEEAEQLNEAKRQEVAEKLAPIWDEITEALKGIQIPQSRRKLSFEAVSITVEPESLLGTDKLTASIKLEMVKPSLFSTYDIPGLIDEMIDKTRGHNNANSYYMNIFTTQLSREIELRVARVFQDNGIYCYINSNIDAYIKPSEAGQLEMNNLIFITFEE